MSTVAQSKSVGNKKVLAPFVAILVVCSVLPFVFWPALILRAGSTEFLPHRFCYLNSSELIWVNVISDAIIGLAYIAISATLAYLVSRNRGDIPFSWMFLAFGLFIVSCGFTHLMEVVTVWRPYYWLAADVKVVTAIASVVTAFALPTLVPRVTAQAVFVRRQAQAQQELEQTNIDLLRLEEMSAELARRVSNDIAFWERDLIHSTIRWWGDVERVFGVPKEGVPKLNTVDGIFTLVHPDDRARINAELARSARDGDDFDVEFRVITPEGKIRWIMGRGSAIYDEHGRAVRMVGVNMNVTHRRLADEAMQRSEKLALTGRMAATIAHEINNPLSSVTNLNYLIAHDANVSSTVRDMATLSMHELERIAHIVRSTLAFHRGSGAATKLDLAELVNASLALYESQLRIRGVEIRRTFDSQVSVIGVSTDLRQVFANLIGNAVDVLPSGGKIGVRIRRQGIMARVDVIDSGPGIDPVNRERLFEPFFTTKGERGTGLGLWVTSGIVEKHGGNITVRSRCGTHLHGTRFTVRLPAGDVHAS